MSTPYIAGIWNPIQQAWNSIVGGVPIIGCPLAILLTFVTFIVFIVIAVYVVLTVYRSIRPKE